MKLNFAIDLTGFDIKQYQKNPIVTYNFDDSQPVGKAVIADDKQSVTVSFMPKEISPLSSLLQNTAEYISVAPAYLEDKNELVCISVVPKYPEKKLEGDIGVC